MKDLNCLMIIGRLIKDPEIKYTAKGDPVTIFTIANNDGYTKDPGDKSHVNFFDVNVWGPSAVNCEKYLAKGSQVAIQGKIKQSRWTDNGSGSGRSKVEITAFHVQFLTPSNQGQQSQAPNNPQQQQPGPPQQYQQPQPQQYQQPNQPQQGAIVNPWDDSQIPSH